VAVAWGRLREYVVVRSIEKNPKIALASLGILVIIYSIYIGKTAKKLKPSSKGFGREDTRM
jgi:hypothetical protein